MKKTVTLSSSGLHNPLAVEVRTSITLPPAISAAVGTKVPVNVVAEGVNVPPGSPSDTHIPLPVEDEPLNAAFGLFIQTEIFAPAFTRGASVMVTIMASVTGLQSPTPVVVSVIVTLPAAVSAGLGL